MAILAVRVSVEEKKRLRVLAAELGMSIQQLVRKLIRGTGNG